MKPAFEKALSHGWLRCSADLLLSRLAWWMLAGGIAATLAALLDRLLFADVFGLRLACGLAAAAALAAGVVWFISRPTRLATAILIDQRLGLKERFSTAVVLGQSDDAFAAAACADARGVASGVDIRGAFPLRLRRTWVLSLAAWGAAVGIACLVPSLDLLQYARNRQDKQEQANQLQQARTQIDQAVKNVDAVVSRMGDPAMQAQLAGLANAKNLATGDDAKRQAIAKLDELSKRLKDMQAAPKAQASRELRDMLQQLRTGPKGPAQALNNTLAKGDFRKAAEMLKELSKRMDDGKLDAEGRKELAAQLSDLARQLEKLAEKNEGLKEALREAGMDENLAGADPNQLRKALADKGMSPEQIEELMKKAQASAGASKAMQRLARAMAKCQGPSGDMADGELAGAIDQLSELEAAEMERALAEAGQNELQRVLRGLGGDGPGLLLDSNCEGSGPFAEGEKRLRSRGTGGPGEGMGARDTDTSGETALEKTLAPGQVKAGPMIASTFFKGAQVKGEAKKELSQVVQAAKDASAEAITENQIPRRYQGAVKKYFGELESAGGGNKDSK